MKKLFHGANNKIAYNNETTQVAISYRTVQGFLGVDKQRERTLVNVM